MGDPVAAHAQINPHPAAPAPAGIASVPRGNLGGARHHPLQGTLARLDDLGGYREFRLRRDQRAGWVTCAQLTGDTATHAPTEPTGSPRALREWVDSLHMHLQCQRPGREVPATVAPGYVLNWYLAVLAAVAAGTFHHARRIPCLDPQTVAIRLHPAALYPCGIAIEGAGEFACLPDDPEAGHPLATVVEDEQALAAELRGRCADHAAGFINGIAAVSKFGRRTLWAAVTDTLETALWRAGQARGLEDAGVRDARMVFPPTPYGGSPSSRPVAGQSRIEPMADAAGTEHWCQRRRSCCFHYALAGAEAACLSCPRISASQRAERMAQQ